MKAFDLIVLGGGSGGLAMAQRAAEHGAKVVLLEPARLGGTCVNVGCVPKKVMWNAAELGLAAALARDYGFETTVAGHDWARLKRGRDAYVARLNGIYARNLARREIEVVASKGRFAGPHEVVDDAGTRYTAPHILIATGGYPIVPDLPGADLGITSDGFFELETRPKRVALVGSGYVAVELGGVLRALGSEVTLFVRFDRVLRSFDPLLSDHLMAHMRASGIEIVTGATPHAVHRASPRAARETNSQALQEARVSYAARDANSHAAQEATPHAAQEATPHAAQEATPHAPQNRGPLALELEDGRRHDGFDALIWAVGRTPNVAALALDRAGITPTDRGHIPVDAYENTEADGIYAIGDVTGRAELTPVAIAAGRRLAERLFAGRPESRLSYDVIPTVIFSHPPIGTIGLAEGEALERYPSEPVRTYTSEFVPMLYALSDEKPRAAMKLVVVGEDERIVGCHVIGPGADEMTQGFAVALTMGARKRDFDATIAIHPTSAEEMVTMR